MAEAGNGRHADPPTVGIVVTGDNHLSPALPRLSPPRRAARREWLRRGFQAAVDYAIAHGAALFVNTGDLFDNPAPSNQDRAFVAAQLARLGQASVTSVAIGGNHDTPRLLTEHGGEAPQRVYDALGGFHYFAASDTLRPRLFTLRGLRVAVTGLSNNPVAPPGSDPLAGVTLDDPEGVLASADSGLVILHAAVEGLARPSEGERMVTLASIDALPSAYHTVVSGHIHRFARQRLGQREVVIIGATERMEFGGASGAPGFVWMELGPGGARRVEHIRIEPQPRAEVTLSVHDLWPELAADAPGQPLQVIRAALEPHSGPEVMARLRLTGELTRERYHQLALREIVLMGQQRFFSLDIDTSGLTIIDPTLTLPTFERDGEPRALADVLRQTLAEMVRLSAKGEDGAPTEEDARAAGDLLLARLRELDAMDGEAV
ncbi:MAG TPA: metallophosphoesterase [Ktedonobacterales bacterium]|nr:metallophosphoesterase [Ktedonobacterales bacterium]